MQALLKYSVAALLLLSAHWLSGQIQRDSIYFGKGIPETTDFETEIRVYFEAYNNDGRPIEVRSEKKNSDGEWSNWRKRTFTYEDDLVSQVLIQYWKQTTQEWEDAIERSFEYDTDGNRTSKLVRRAPSVGMSLENQRRWSFSYDGNGNQNTSLYEEWNGGAWENISQQLWTYNGNNLVTEQLLQLWEDGTWTNARRQGWQYDGTTGLTSNVVQQTWDADNQSWLNVERQEYENDGMAFWTGIRKSTWDNDLDAWVPVEQELFEYSPTFQLENRTTQEWNGSEWINQLQVSYGIDGEILSAMADAWDPLQEEWKTAARYQVDYENLERPITEQGWQFWDENSSTWQNDTISFQRLHFWSDPVSTKTVLDIPQNCTIQNPYPLGSSINCSQIQGRDIQLSLFNTMGQVVHRQRFENGATLSISGQLTTGLYLLSIESKEGIQHLQKLFIK